MAALGSTTVNPPPPTPTFQVPASTPPLQNQVTAGTDGGWGATIANTSTATVTGLAASVSVTDGGPALSYDLAGMAASGTNCSAAGSGKVTCPLGNLAAGASDSLDVLVRTTGLVTGVAITGSASITSSNASTHATTLGSIGVIVVQSGNSAKAVAAPGIAGGQHQEAVEDGQGLDHPHPAHQEDPEAGGRTGRPHWPSRWPPPRRAPRRWR